jgi:hypothetical protein
MDDIFAYNIALEVLKDNKNLKSTSVEECRQIKMERYDSIGVKFTYIQSVKLNL